MKRTTSALPLLRETSLRDCGQLPLKSRQHLCQQKAGRDAKFA